MTSILDLDMDSLTQCTNNLNVQDISNMAMSCKCLRAACSDSAVWQPMYRREWPGVPTMPESSIREAYSARKTALRLFKYADPVLRVATMSPRIYIPTGHLLFDNNSIIFNTYKWIYSFQIDDLINENADIRRCHRTFSETKFMRLFSLNGRESPRDNVLITSTGFDLHVWGQKEHRYEHPHTAEVSAISDRVLDGDNGKVFASGGEDKTVRLWSINPTRKWDKYNPKATFYRHETTVSLIAVAGHNISRLVSASKDGKVCVWETNEALSKSTCPVGTTSVPALGPPVAIKCHESLLHIAAGYSVISIDLRTMGRVSTLVLPERICSFEASPSKFLFCTGEDSSAKLWDIRKVCGEPIADFGHEGPVKFIHMDPYKVVTGGPCDPSVKIWEVGTGAQTNSLYCAGPGECESPNYKAAGCSAMDVDGCRIVTASTLNGFNKSVLTYRDFTNATCDVQSKSNVSDALGRSKLTVS